jgi:ATP-dependent helicase/nuclease subunit A
LVPKATGNFVDWLEYVRSTEPAFVEYEWTPNEVDLDTVGAENQPLVLGEDIDDIMAHQYRYIKDTKVEKKYTVTALNSRDGGDDVTLPSFLGGQEMTTRGTLYHTIFQHIDYAATTQDAVREELNRLIDEAYLTAEEVAQVDAAKVAACLSLPLMQRTRQAGVQVYHEQRFVLSECARALGLDADDDVLVQGVIDLMMVEKGKLTVVDFKLSDRAEDKLREAYKTQLALYCKAAAIACHCAVDACALVEINRAKVIEM